MITTITMNPSTDISYVLDKFELGRVNRTSKVSKTAGGKGLNVSRVLYELSENIVATGLLGGKHGEFIQEKLNQQGIQNDFFYISGESRDSVAVLHEGNQTEILESGPTISPKELQGFNKKVESLLNKTNLLVISGSLPQGVPDEYYANLIEKANLVGVRVLLDTSGRNLKKSLKSEKKPYLIKPNTEEIAELLYKEVDVESLSSIKEILFDKIFDGITWIVVSLGGEGAIIRVRNEVYRATLPTGLVIKNPVGSGDATIAGFASALSHEKEVIEIIKTGMTCGVLNAQEEVTGHINQVNFKKIYDEIQVENII